MVWFDALVTNVDRTAQNPNLLLWHGALWLIDHGASLYFHHAWSGGVTDPARFAAQAWDPSDHVLLAQAGDLAAVDVDVSDRLDESVFAEILDEVPDEWLEPVPGAEDPAAVRAAYVAFLAARLGTRQWLPGGAA